MKGVYLEKKHKSFRMKVMKTRYFFFLLLVGMGCQQKEEAPHVDELVQSEEEQASARLAHEPLISLQELLIEYPQDIPENGMVSEIEVEEGSL